MPLDLSLNLATVRRQWKLPEAVAAAARHGFAGVAPWREMVQETGVAESARIFEGSGLRVTGYCRGGLEPPQAIQECAEQREGADQIPEIPRVVPTPNN